VSISACQIPALCIFWQPIPLDPKEIAGICVRGFHSGLLRTIRVNFSLGCGVAVIGWSQFGGQADFFQAL
jgi:hypothetical protein